uniref:Scaffold protein ILK n=1 Tax=Knipowitschia caucasica TaxID=637954 RepID=A0AAV2J9B9_KNICA
MMEPDSQLRNLRDFLLVYNRMTEICFQRCSTNFNYRSLTMDEERCVDNCAGKLIRSNHRLMGTYVTLMPKMVQRRMEEMESKMAENAKMEAEAAAKAGVLEEAVKNSRLHDIKTGDRSGDQRTEEAFSLNMDDIFTQCREGNSVAVRLWLDNTENDLNLGDDHGFSPLHWACREGRSGVVDMLIMRGARINVMNRGDDTPLHLASSHGHRDIVAKLIQCKADPNTVNEHGNTPLHYACFWGQDQVAEDLVASGAQVCVCNRYGQTPLDKAKAHLKQLLQEKAEKTGQNMAKIPYKETFWKGTMRTRPRNGTLNKQAGIDYTQLSLLAKINENQSGELWQGRWQGDEIIVKVLHVRDWTTRKSRDFNEEHPKLRIFSHPNILPVLGACQSPPSPHPILITRYMPYGSLFNILHQGTTLVVDQSQAVKFALDIASGMAFLHTLEPMVSRLYLNSKHVMIDEDMTGRISMADAKLSFQCPGRMYSPAWMAPEALQKRPEDINRRSADMWSFAVLLWELVTREVPFADLSNMEIGMKVSLEGLRPTIPPGISPHICKLMRLCMNEDPAKRPKFDMIVPILEKMQDK